MNQKFQFNDTYTSQLPFYWLTFKSDLDLHLTWINVSNEHACQIILKSMYKCRSYGPDKLNLDHFIIWRSSVTLTFNVSEQKFQTAFLLLKENNSQIIFKSMQKCTRYGPEKLNLWPFYRLTFKCDLDRQPTPTNVSMTLLLLKENCAKLFWNPCIYMYKLWPGQIRTHARTHNARTHNARRI